MEWSDSPLFSSSVKVVSTVTHALHLSDGEKDPETTFLDECFEKISKRLLFAYLCYRLETLAVSDLLEKRLFLSNSLVIYLEKALIAIYLVDFPGRLQGYK